jgi:GAF domain/ANTAR domain
MEAFSAAASAMAEDHNVLDVVATLLHDCVALLPAASAAIMVVQDERLVLLHSSSHRASEIELLQVQSDEGPCIDCIAAGAYVSASGHAAIAARWNHVSDAIDRSGYQHVSALPMRWHEHVLGGLNIFREDPRPLTPTELAVAQGFANMASLTVVTPSDVPVDRLAARVAEAIQSRSLVEQAKGVLSQLHGVDLSNAYDMLLERSVDGVLLTSAAEKVLSGQYS